MPEIEEDLVPDQLELDETITNENAGYRPLYGSVESANRYWSERLNGQLWEVTSEPLKLKALTSATGNIDGLRFHGDKTSPTQLLEFPRNGEVYVPQDIQYATFEEAMALLKGIDPETEAGNLFVESRVFGNVRTNYDYRTAPQHTVAGLASSKAWKLLLPFLNPARGVQIRRRS